MKRKHNYYFTAIMALSVMLSGCSASAASQPQEESPTAVLAEPVVLENSSLSSSAVSKPEVSKGEVSKAGNSKEEVSKGGNSKEEVSKAESSKEEVSKAESSKEEVSKAENSKEEVSKAESSKEEVSKAESSKEEVSKAEASKEEVSKAETSQAETSRQEISAAFFDVTGVTVSAKEITIPLGGTYRIYCTFAPENATNPKYLWHIEGTNIIDFAPDGTITAKEIGTATVTAKTYNNLTDTCTITVTEPPPPPVITGETVSAHWFDDAVFIGDSVTNTLSFYADNGCLGDAEFIPAVGIGYHSALWDLNASGNVHPVYNGQKMLMEDAVKLSGKKKVFIMLGMNDFAWSIDSIDYSMRTLVDRILQKCPDAQIYLQSVTPMISSMHRDDALNNANIALFNQRIKQFCTERGYHYLDISSAVEDGSGNLRYEYCFDPDYMGLHMNNAGCEQWVNYLKTHVI